jgi:hypothetical protein
MTVPEADQALPSRMVVVVDLSNDARGEEQLRATLRSSGARRMLSDVVYREIDAEQVGLGRADPAFLEEQRAFVADFDAAASAAAAAGDERFGALAANFATLWTTNFAAAHLWLFALARLVAECRAERSQLVILLPRAPASRLVYLYEAEGETSTTSWRALMYSRPDYLLAVIRAYLEQFPEVRIEWYGAPWLARRLPLRFVRVLRSYGVLALRVLIHVRNRLRHFRMAGRRPAGEGVERSVEPVSCVLTRAHAHTEYVRNLARAPDVEFLVADGFRSYPATFNLFRRVTARSNGVRHLYDHVGAWTIVRLGLGVAARMLADEFTARGPLHLPAFEGRYGVAIPSRQLVREGLVSSFEPLLVATALEDYLSTRPSVGSFVHCELVSQFPRYLDDVCSAAAVASIQVAFGTYEILPTPRFVHATRFCCFSETMRVAMLAQFPWLEDAVRYWGNLFIDECGDARARGASRIANRAVVFFSQPIDEEHEFLVVSQLAEWCAGAGYRCLVALHPRDRADKFAALGSRVEVLHYRDLLPQREAVLESVTFAVTRTSNIGYYLLLAGVPLINVTASPQDLAVVHEYYPGYPLRATTLAEMRSLLDRAEESQVAYEAFRAGYIGTSWLGSGWQTFLRELRCVSASGKAPLASAPRSIEQES